MIAYDGSFPKLDCQKLADATLTEVELSKEGDGMSEWLILFGQGVFYGVIGAISYLVVGRILK